ncbi:MAG: hypothetical protein JXR13_03235 [Thalassovita sp.]
MKYFTLALVASLGLTACQTTTEGSSQATVVDTLIGKTLKTENGSTFILSGDGTVGGLLRGDPIVGTYDANAREICSTYSKPQALAGKEFCSVPTIDGNTVVFKRRDGSNSPIYYIQ